MDIVEAILIERKKYIVLISGYLWWEVFNSIVSALGKNLNFEVIFVNQLIPENMLVTTADHINFPVINEIIKEKLNDIKEQKENKKGFIVVSYTFPPEKIDFYPDIHINLSANPILLTNLIVELAKEKQFKRIDIDNHISYLTKSWKTNKIGKSIILFPDYLNKINDIYGMIFDSIMDNIMKKLYGEKYEEYKNQGKINIISEPNKPTEQKDHKLIHVADPTKISQKDQTLISDGIKSAKFTTDLDDIIIETDNEIDSDDIDESNDSLSPALKRSNPYSVEENLLLYDDVLNSIQNDDSDNDTDISNIMTESSTNSIKEMLLGQKAIYIGRRFNEKY
jgi:hypothetical protein